MPELLSDVFYNQLSCHIHRILGTSYWLNETNKNHENLNLKFQKKQNINLRFLLPFIVICSDLSSSEGSSDSKELKYNFPKTSTFSIDFSINNLIKIS